jgi:transcriptional/translational regulatory protein YebC/TACO1
MVADNNTLTPEQMEARIAELEGRLANSGTLSFMLAEKGAVSVYGLGRFPVTLYFEQWNKLLAHADKLRTFLEANQSKLKLKEQSPR